MAITNQLTLFVQLSERRTKMMLCVGCVRPMRILIQVANLDFAKSGRITGHPTAHVSQRPSGWTGERAGLPVPQSPYRHLERSEK